MHFQLLKMQIGLVFLTVVYWAFFVFTTNGLDDCHTFLPSQCKDARCDVDNVDNENLICCNVTKDFAIKEKMRGKNIKHLYFYNATMENLSLQADSNIESLTITYGNIKNISFTGKFNNIKCLNLSNNHLINVTIKSSMPKLRIMDLSKNNLTSLPDIEKILDLVQNITIDISDNKEVSCTVVKSLLKKKSNKTNLEFRNKNNTICSAQSTFQWFDSAFQVRLPHLETTQCEETVGMHGCRCEIARFIPPTESQPLLILLDVNCSSLQLRSLPPHLPPNTVSLDVSNNNITSLDQMKESSYSGVRTLHAQNNYISSISVLEGTPFMSNFSILDIRWNNLTSVPTYFLSNRLDRNYASDIRLGGNKLLCDCNTAQVLKVWLSVHKKYVQDYKDIECRNLPKNVMLLDQRDVCVTQRKWTDYIYYIIAGEVVLLIFLVSKVSYDYWIFKTAGYLPWPASKMPKLPCDWVFET